MTDKEKEPEEVEMLDTKEKKKEDDGEIKLKAEMTLMNGCTVIIGCIIGSGIFVSPTGVLQSTGSVNLSIVVWIICGLFTMIGNWKHFMIQRTENFLCQEPTVMLSLGA